MNSVLQEQGSFVLMGGSERKQINIDLIEAMVELTGKTGDARIGIIPTASEKPDSMAARYIEPLKHFGIHSIQSLDLDSASKQESFSEIIESLDVLLFTGGDQLRLLNALSNASFRDVLRQFHTRGGVIAGSSAGAMALGNPVIVRGEPESFAHLGALLYQDGFNLIEDTIIDTHLVHRNRLGRLLHSAAIHKGKTVLGIQESTGLVMSDRHATVIGTGIVVMVESASPVPRIEKTEENQLIYAEDLRVRILPRGTHFFLPLAVTGSSRS